MVHNLGCRLIIFLVWIFINGNIHGTCNETAGKLSGQQSPESNPLQEMRNDVLAFFEKHGNVTPESLPDLGDFLTKERLVPILEQLLVRSDLADEVRQLSYFHPLGFSKIVLLTGSKEKAWDLRFHIWLPEHLDKAVDWVEGIHEHRWDFGSRILLGELENHRYRKAQLSENNAKLMESFKSVAAKATGEELQDLYSKLDLISVLQERQETKLHDILGGRESIEIEIGFPVLTKRWGFNRNQLKTLSGIFSKFSSWKNWETEPNTAYMVETMQLTNVGTTIHKGNEIYFHPIGDLHRLVIPPDRVTATFLLVGPSKQTPGLLRRDPTESVHSDNNPKNNFGRIEFTRHIEKLLRYLIEE